MSTEPNSSPEIPQNSITVEYGRKINLTEEQIAEWLEDLFDETDEIMARPLRVGSSFSPFAFCAPEVIRGAVAHHILRTNIESDSMFPTDSPKSTALRA